MTSGVMEKIMNKNLGSDLIPRGYLRANTLKDVLMVFVGLGCFVATALTNIVNTETRLFPNDSRTNLFFGTAVAIEGGTAAVGAPDNDNGAVYTFNQVGTNWFQAQKITMPGTVVPFDGFGRAVAMDGNTLAVGQPIGLTFLSGQVYVFTRVGTNFIFQQTLVGNVSQTGGFGSTVDVSGSTLVTGDPTESSIEVSSGAIYVFQRFGTNWVQQAFLKPNIVNPNVNFGSSVAIDGDTVIAGAPLQGNRTQGAVYIFVRTGTNWVQQALLQPLDLTIGAAFGTDVAIQGNLAVVGAPGQNIGGLHGGAVYIYLRTGTMWNLVQTLVSQPNADTLEFGSSVAIDNGTIVVGAEAKTVNGQGFAGAVDLYVLNGTNWVFAQEVTATDPRQSAFFGRVVDISSGNIIVGAPFDSEDGQNAGAAYIFSNVGSETFSANATPSVLRVPNHKLVPVTISVSETNGLHSCHIVSVTSNEPENPKSSGKQQPDWVITGDLSLLLRAERSGRNKQGRIYTITVECTDAFGSSVTTTTSVIVPHDSRR
jgi:hypothetical protein